MAGVGSLVARTDGEIAGLAKHLGDNFGDATALIARTVLFSLGWLALALPAGNRRRVLGRAADDRFVTHLLRVAIVETNDRHAKVQQVRKD